MDRVPAQGPQQPGNYPVAPGPKYQYYGEQQGWLYNPYTDEYVPDPKSSKQWAEQTGLVEPEPKPPGLGEQLLPVAGAAGAAMAGKEIGEKIVGGFMGSGAPATPTTVATGTGGGAAASTGGAGFMTPSTVLAEPIAGSGGVAAGGGGATTGLSAGGVASNAGSIGGVAGVAVPAAVVGATALGGKAAYDMIQGKKPNTAGRVILGMATGGLSEGLSKIAKATGLIGRKETKDYQKERWGKLGSEVPEDSPTAQYISQYKQHIENPGDDVNPPKPFEEMSGLELTPGVGFFETFKNDWLEKFTEDQRIQIAQTAKDRGLLDPEKGDILVTDKDAVRDIGNEVLGVNTEQATAMPRPTPGNMPAVEPNRTETLSPGIGLDGKPIRRGMM